MKFNAKNLQQMSNSVRANALRMILSAKSGHVGIVLDSAEIITTIFANHLRYGADKFIMSAGHGSALLYSVLKFAGYNIGDINSFRKINGLPGHPEINIDGVDATTGPLGQGIANSVGIALAQKIQKTQSWTYCLCSDGDLMEGVSFEAMVLAGRLQLNNLIVLWDDNGLSIDGTAQTDINVCARMRSLGWNVMSVNGNDISAIDSVLLRAKKSELPVFIQCKNILGRGSSLENSSLAHGLSLSESELLSLIVKNTSTGGEKLWNTLSHTKIKQDTNTEIKLNNIKLPIVPDNISTRDLSGIYLNELIKSGANLILGSADLSENTKVKVQNIKEITKDNFNGNFINYGVREHAMAAIMNGLASNGIKTVGSTFLVFSDYMRPAIRLSAMSKLPVIYVFTHDSICVGEDGPTHQPIEQLSSLRMIPNLNVYRPCNITEIAYTWNTAIQSTDSPTAIILSRQKFQQIQTPKNVDLSFGAYVIYPAKKRVKMTLLATGSEVPLAVSVASQFTNIQVVSVLNMNVFRNQTSKYKQKILYGCVIAIEAGSPNLWFEFADAVIGIDKFGTSGNATDIYREYGFDKDKIITEIKKYLK